MSSIDIYYNSYSSALSSARDFYESKGFFVSDSEWWSNVSVGKPKPDVGETNRISLFVKKNGKLIRKCLHLQIYNRGTLKNEFELNHYLF